LHYVGPPEAELDTPIFKMMCTIVLKKKKSRRASALDMDMLL